MNFSRLESSLGNSLRELFSQSKNYIDVGAEKQC